MVAYGILTIDYPTEKGDKVCRVELTVLEPLYLKFTANKKRGEPSKVQPVCPARDWSKNTIFIRDRVTLTMGDG